MKQTYDNYFREYLKTPNGRAAHNRAKRRYNAKLRRLFPGVGIHRASKMYKESRQERAGSPR